MVDMDVQGLHPSGEEEQQPHSICTPPPPPHDCVIPPCRRGYTGKRIHLSSKSSETNNSLTLRPVEMDRHYETFWMALPQ